MLICGFETFNLITYKSAAINVASRGIYVSVFTDKQLEAHDPSVIATLQEADVLFCSLIFDYDQIEWLASRIPAHTTVFVFESALELMSYTKVGSFTMQSSTASSGIPDGVRFVLRKLGLIGREEDKLAGYLALLKNAPRLLKLVPGQKARDLRNWLTVYSYWNAGGSENVTAMFDYIAGEVFGRAPSSYFSPALQIPNVGLLHPEYDGFFDNPRQYVEWYEITFPERKSWPRVAILLYRKHVVSNLMYIPELIALFEAASIAPLPVFITGVEAHIILRDYLTSDCKERARQSGDRVYGSFKRGKTASVDAVVSTIGYVGIFFLKPLETYIPCQSH